MIIQHNLMALNAYNRLGNNNNLVSKNLEKLSSGFRINRAGDDASGLAVSEKMRAQITSLDRATMNAKDGISVVQTAEGALTEVHSMLNRLVELGTQSANGVYQKEDREKIQAEVDQITEEIDRISQATNFNGINLLDGSLGDSGAFKTSHVDAVVADAPALTPTAAIGANTPVAVSGTGTAIATPDISGKIGDNEADPNIALAADAVHFTVASVAEQDPSFTIDLASLNVSGFEDGDTLALSIGAATVTLKAVDGTTAGQTATNAGTATAVTADADLSGVTTENIAAAFAHAISNVPTVADTSPAGVIQLGGAFYTAVADGTQINFTYAGTVANKAAASGGDPITAAVLSPVSNVSVAAANGAGGADTSQTVTGALNQATLNVVNPQVADGGKPAGVAFDMATDVVADGNRLTIDDKTFIFKTDKGSNYTAGANEVVIDVSSKAAGNDQIVEAIRLMSSQTTTNFKLSASSAGTNTVLNVEQTMESANGGKVYGAQADINGVFKLTTPASETFTLTDAMAKDGNKLTVGETTYVVTSGADSDVTADDLATGEVLLTATNATELAAALKTAIATKQPDSGSTASVDTTANTITLKSAAVSAAEPLNTKVKTGAPASVAQDMTALMEDGATLSFDGKTFVFKTDADSTVTADATANETLIDVSGYATPAEQAAAAAKALSDAATTTTDKFEVGADGVNLVLSQRANNDETYTATQLEGVMKAGAAPTTPAGVKITVDAAELRNKDSMRIDDKTFQFVSKAGTSDMTGSTEIVINGLDKGTATAEEIVNAISTTIGRAAYVEKDATSITLQLNADGTAPEITGGGLTLQVGDTADAFNKVTVAVDDMSASGLGLGELNVTEQGLSSDSISKVKAAIEKVSVNRGRLGALQNRMEYTINNLTTTTENMTAAESRIRDTDMAKEMMAFTKNNVLVQAAQAMLAQANQQPQQVLQLLR